jgi:tetratricopeptide (TPR) repeat protein
VITLCASIRVLATDFQPSDSSSPDYAKTVPSRQAAAIERKGLPEFNSENDAPRLSRKEKAQADEALPALKQLMVVTQMMGDGKDRARDQQALDAVGKIVQKYPTFADAHVMRANLAVLTGATDYGAALADIDSAISVWHKNPSNRELPELTVSSTGAPGLYALRAKLNLLAGNSAQALADLETAVTTNVDKTNDVFNTGSVKPEDDSSQTSIHKRDLDALVASHPMDYRPLMFRGLFYLSFTPYGDESNYSRAIEDLIAAQRLRPGSALVSYFIGFVYYDMGLMTKAAWADISDLNGEKGGYRQGGNAKALEYLQRAVQLDPHLKPAQALQAGCLYNLKRYSEAIASYDSAIELDPNDFGAENDRGLAENDRGNYYGAISDFSRAIDLMRQQHADITYLTNAYELRAKAYAAIGKNDEAAQDYSRMIGRWFGMHLIATNLTQIRNVYPEFGTLPDRELIEGLRQKYYPAWTLAHLTRTLTENRDTKHGLSNLLAGAYVNRADAYLRGGRWQSAAKDYARALHSDPDHHVDRWRVLASSDFGKDYAIDIQTWVLTPTSASFWLRSNNAKSDAYDLTRYQVDCGGRRLRLLSSTTYDANGTPTEILNGNGWQAVADIGPNTKGEMLYRAACRSDIR